MKTCPKCNYLIENNSAKFCGNCGANVEHVSSENVQTTSVSPVTEELLESLDTTTKNKYTPTHTYTPEISGFFTFVLWMIVLGGIITLISGIATLDIDSYEGVECLLLCDLSICILTPIVAIYSVVSAYKKRPGSVKLVRVYLWFVLLSRLFSMLFNDFENMTIYIIGGIVWNIIFISYMYFSENVKDVFPKETRKTNALDKFVLWFFIMVPIIFFIIGILQIV